MGSADHSIASNVTAEIIIADQKIDRQLDPAELGAGIESLGKITMHGAAKSPTFVRLAKEPLAGQTTLTTDAEHSRLESRRSHRDSRYPAATRSGTWNQLQGAGREVEIASMAENQITLTAPSSTTTRAPETRTTSSKCSAAHRQSQP